MATRIPRGWRAGRFLAFGVAVALTGAYAIDDIPYHGDIGLRRTCDADVVAVLSGEGIDAQVSLSGPATFEYVANSSADEIFPWSDLTPVSGDHEGNDPTLGDVSLELVAVDDGSLSRIQSVAAGKAFPAKGTLSFHGRVTLGNRPDIVYNSSGPIVIGSDEFNEWPHNHTLYRQIGSTNFEDPNSPGEVAFTLSNAEVRVTAQ